MQKQLSTASSAPEPCATAAIAAMSEISVSGLDGVSRKNKFRIGAHRRLPLGHVGGGNKSRLHAEFLDDVVEQVDRRAENAARGDDVVARLEQAHHARQDRRHAGCRGDALLRAFQRGEPLSNIVTVGLVKRE